jgi:hypothetical protein
MAVGMCRPPRNQDVNSQTNKWDVFRHI